MTYSEFNSVKQRVIVFSNVQFVFEASAEDDGFWYVRVSMAGIPRDINGVSIPHYSSAVAYVPDVQALEIYNNLLKDKDEFYKGI